MASDLENLKARRSNILARLAAMDGTGPGDRVDLQAMGSGSQHVAYKDGLYRELETIERLIAKADDGSGAGGSFEIASQGLV